MSDEERYEGGHIDTPAGDGADTRRRPQSDPIDTPYPEGGIGARPQRVEGPEPRFWRLRQRPNPYFMGRETLMIALHTAFQTKPVVHLRGPLGSGTTQTALAYALRARPNFDAVLWVDGKNNTLARFDLARACTGLDSAWSDEARLSKHTDAIMAWMKSHLRWLLVIDGAVSFDDVRAIIPAEPSGRILITGAHPLEDDQVEVLDHPNFNHQSACLFLAHRSQQERDANVAAVVRLFDHATLPVFLAGAYCHASDTPLDIYLKRVTSALERRAPDPSDSVLGRNVLAAVEISLQFASARNPAALEMMALCAWFDTEDIALAMLCDGAAFLPRRLGGCVTEPSALNETLSLLHRLGLVQFEQNSVAVHGTIQAAIRTLLGPEQAFAWLMTALRVLREAFPVEPRYVPPIPACSMLLRHVFAVTACSERSEQLREGTGLLLNHVGLYLHACKELSAARTCFERSIRLAESFHGSVHPTVAARVNSLGVVLQDLGEYTEALAAYERAFQICEIVYGPARDAAMGPAHRSMLTMPSRNLCQVLELMDDIPAAKSAYQRAVNTFIEIYCWNHSLVAESMAGLGQLYFKEKNYAVARQYFEKAILAEENAEAPELGNLARFSRNLAQCYLEEDDFGSARELFEQALHMDREDFGARHRYVAIDLIGLGKTFRGQSLFNEAQGCFDEALAVFSAITQEATREKSQVWRHKGRAYMDAQDYEDAVRCLNESLRITRLADGKESTALGPDYVYLGRALARLDRLPEAERAFVAALKLHHKHAWLDADGLNALYTRLAKVMRDQRRIDEAIVLFKNAMKLNRERHGARHDIVGADAHHLGNLYLAASDYDAALDYLQEALNIYEETRGPDDPRTRRVMQRIDSLKNSV